jgi:cytochrome c biogenesis protein CcmG/thiol:disulfide interchange protein DsbE
VTAAAETRADPPALPRRRRRWLGLLVLLVVVAAVGALLAGRLGGSDQAPSALVGRPAPPLAGETLAGDSFDLAQWDGQIVLVNVWASWCVPCRREQPLLAAAQSQLGPRGLQVVGIDVREPADDARAFLAQFSGGSWPSVRDPDGTRAVEWGTFALPETYLVGRDGTVVAKAVGELDAAWIDAHVVPLLGEGGP